MNTATPWPRRVLNTVTLHPMFTRVTARFFYPLLTRAARKDDVLFLNFGYEEDPPMGVALSESDEADRYLIQLYHRTAGQADLRDKRVLEVSCGHGGGASYLMRTLQPASYTGTDLNAAGIEFCRDRHRLPGLTFVQADAVCLPFGDEEFDIVVNVEASHCYSDLMQFLTEVHRVLRPGGYFLYTDLRRRDDIDAWQSALAGSPLREVSSTTINEEVRRGLELNWPSLLSRIQDRLPPLEILHRMAASVAGGPGSMTYNNLESGEYAYRLYSFVKD
ncbi:phthiotriol/phenolphthiotriol dimycocerosates methyltransferase [Mycobacterium sp. 48b]|uniref:phthiotriol/phenolphthiotriol dimycocerosates methyltransferase n=1 Tax=Mycobacterium sp. 48b TaxID=3400426 RepID=UPI003AAB5BEA